MGINHPGFEPSKRKSESATSNTVQVYQQVQAAIQARDLERAHNLLRGLIREDGDDPNYLLLMAWTAPTQRTAELIFKQFQSKYPNHPKARKELFWSGKEWAKSAGDILVNVPPTPAGLTSSTVQKIKQPSVRETQAERAEKRARLAGRMVHRSFYKYLGIYMAGITLAELVTTFVSPLLGLVLHGGLLVVILMHTALSAPGEQNFFLALALAPLIRLVSLSMPLLHFEFKYWYLVIGLPLLIASFMVLRLSGYARAHVGLSLGRYLPIQIMVAIAGIGLGYMEYQILKPEPLTDTFSLQSVWLPALILLVFTGFLEELIFRGLMQRAAAAQFRKFGSIYISLLFAVLHIGYKSLVDLAFVFMVGFFFSIIAEHTRSLLGVTISHGLTNISLFLIFPFVLTTPISLDMLPELLLPGDSSLSQPSEVQLSGPAMWVSPPTITPGPTIMPTDSALDDTPPMLSATPTASPTNSPTPFTSNVIIPTATPTQVDRATKTPLPTAVDVPTSTPTATFTIQPVLGTSAPLEPTATEAPSTVH